MKVTLVAICLTVLCIIATDAAGPFDGVNVDAMLRDPSMVRKQIACLNCKGPCDRIGSELKRVIPTIAATNCRQCSASDKISMGKIVNHVQSNYPREWTELATNMRSNRRRC